MCWRKGRISRKKENEVSERNREGKVSRKKNILKALGLIRAGSTMKAIPSECLVFHSSDLLSSSK